MKCSGCQGTAAHSCEYPTQYMKGSGRQMPLQVGPALAVDGEHGAVTGSLPVSALRQQVAQYVAKPFRRLFACIGRGLEYLHGFFERVDDHARRVDAVLGV